MQNILNIDLLENLFRYLQYTVPDTPSFVHGFESHSFRAIMGCTGLTLCPMRSFARGPEAELPQHRCLASCSPTWSCSAIT